MLSLYFAIVCVAIMFLGLLGSNYTVNSGMSAIYKLMMFFGSAGCMISIIICLALLVL